MASVVVDDAGHDAVVIAENDVLEVQPATQPINVASAGVDVNFGLGIAFTGDGRFLTAGFEEPHVVDVASWSVIGDSFAIDDGFGIDVTANGRFATTVSDGRLHVWDIDPDSWFDTVCHAASRTLSAVRWAQHGPPGPVLQTCPQWPVAP